MELASVLILTRPLFFDFFFRFLFCSDFDQADTFFSNQPIRPFEIHLYIQSVSFCHYLLAFMSTLDGVSHWAGSIALQVCLDNSEWSGVAKVLYQILTWRDSFERRSSVAKIVRFITDSELSRNTCTCATCWMLACTFIISLNLICYTWSVHHLRSQYLASGWMCLST